ncbi:hypothetical protein KAT80_00900 [Candidatus Pacearchaeota archaeon]|nr:hypothetical protein [Candidatus Pacearchaeota archaeon]
MKTSVIILLILFLPIISAVNIDMKQEFSQGETFMAKVSGNFFESITKENIFFYRGHVRQPMSAFVAKINNDFYIYAQLSGKSPDNYSIVIKNVKYIKGGLIVEEDLAKYFSISSSTADFSIEQGFVITNENFFIEMENLQESEIEISVDSLIELKTEEPIILTSGATKKIYFSIENTNSTFEIIKLSTENSQYEILVSVFGINGGDFECVADDSCKDNTCIGSTCTDDCGNIYDGVKVCVEEDTCENVGTCKLSCDEDSQDLGKLDCGFFYTCCQKITEEQKSFKFEQSELNVIMPTNSHTIREIYLYNTGNKTIENISLKISGELKNYLELSTNKIDKLKPDSNIKIELEFYSFDKGIDVQGKLTAKEQNIVTSSEIFLNIIRDHVPADKYEYSPSIQTQTCAELNGEICSLDEKCDTDYVYAKDGKCCLGECVKQEPSSTGKIIGWAIVGIVVVFLIWFFKTKYRGAKKEVDLFKIGKAKK